MINGYIEREYKHSRQRNGHLRSECCDLKHEKAKYDAGCILVVWVGQGDFIMPVVACPEPHANVRDDQWTIMASLESVEG